MKALKYLTLILAVALVQGCARPKNTIVEVPSGGSAPEVPSLDPAQPIDTVPIQVNSAALQDFLGDATGTVTDIRFGMSMVQVGHGWGGFVKITFKEDGHHREYYQQTKSPNKSSYSSTDVHHNIWFQKDGKNVWHGFFQDRVGAVVIVIDDQVSSGTGDNPYARRLSGSIWYKNFDSDFPNNPVQGPAKSCWEITVGPYDCRTFLVRDNPNSQFSHESTKWSIYTTEFLTPNISWSSNVRDDYKKLTTFTGLSEGEVFGN